LPFLQIQWKGFAEKAFNGQPRRATRCTVGLSYAFHKSTLDHPEYSGNQNNAQALNYLLGKKSSIQKMYNLSYEI
jgi:hypothetical protein